MDPLVHRKALIRAIAGKQRQQRASRCLHPVLRVPTGLDPAADANAVLAKQFSGAIQCRYCGDLIPRDWFEATEELIVQS